MVKSVFQSVQIPQSLINEAGKKRRKHILDPILTRVPSKRKWIAGILKILGMCKDYN